MDIRFFILMIISFLEIIDKVILLDIIHFYNTPVANTLKNNRFLFWKCKLNSYKCTWPSSLISNLIIHTTHICEVVHRQEPMINYTLRWGKTMLGIINSRLYFNFNK